MSHAALVALCVLSATALAQTPPPAPEAASEAPPTAQTSEVPTSDAVSRELEEKLEEAKRELREEVRAQLATQQAASGFEEGFAEEAPRQLELFTLDGYLRTRPKLFSNFTLGRPADPSGFPLFPTAPGQNTHAFADMRLRLDPTLNISEEVAVKLQVDVLDNLVFGSTPETGFTGSPYYVYDVFNESQIVPRSGLNSVLDSIHIRRAYGEVSTPVGVLRFGRMGSHWGLGLLYNDGNCLDCDWGDTVDRIMFVTEVFDGFYVAPMLDFNVEGPTVLRRSALGEPLDVANTDDAHTLGLAIARRDTEQQRRAKLDDDQAVLNYGLHFSYRTQSFSAPSYYAPSPLPPEASDPDPVPQEGLLQARQATLYIPDVWLKLERRDWRVELELAGVFGTIGNARLTLPDGATTPEFPLLVAQFGGALQGEYRLVEGNLRLGMELGFASGDKAPGMGARPGRRPRTTGTDRPLVGTVPGDIDGPQFSCPRAGACTDRDIRNFRFDRDYRVDMILFRDLLTAVTDTAYLRPSATYQVAPGLELFGAAIYSRAIYPQSVPAAVVPEGGGDPTAGVDPSLGLELNAGASYETEDGFVAGVRYGILFPLDGLRLTAGGDQPNAQSIRGFLGIRF